MLKEWDVLVASGNFEHRRSLIRILEELPLNVISASTFQQAEEVLSRQHISLLFSDQRLFRYPFHATDVELQIIRAAHEEQEEAPAAIAQSVTQ